MADRRSTRRPPGAAVRVLVAATFLAGCAGGGDAERAAVVEFWAMGREGEVVRELARDFERSNPDVRIEVQQMPWTAAHEKLLTAFVGQATPDVAQLGNTWVPEFAAIGAIMPLDERIAGSSTVDVDDYFDGIWATNRIDGRVYGVPWYVDTRLLFYRRDILARAGWERPPRSWSQWREAMQDVKRHLGPDHWAILLPTDEWDKLIMFALAAGAPLLRDDGRRAAFDERRFRRALDFYLGLFRDELAPPLARHQIANRYEQFADGEFAMYLSGPWDIGEFRRRLPESLQDDWATAPLPAPDGDSPGHSLAGGSSLVVFDRSEQRDAAWRFVEFLSRPEQQARFYELTGDLPARRTAWRRAALVDDPKAKAFWTQLRRVRPLPAVPEIEEIVNTAAEYGELMVRGRLTADAALSALDRAVDDILEKRRSMLAEREAP